MFPSSAQRGSILIVVLFVILIMGYLATSLTMVRWSNQSSLSRSVLGVQAWFMAQSANEWALTQLYPLNVSEPDVGTFCSDVVSGAIPNIAQGTGCRLNKMTCSSIGSFNAGTSEEESLFRVNAIAICGSGNMQVQRQQEVWVRD
ncbi:hypothetical protein [Vibrio sagamiensis]|uniref:MSHA biogenesis protein MshP n=1 Tax=Vibrio sagamiensis NBRC 104589 TaxID=1219064 RepID=A0A511QF82_9VIBR|nr:hypothetical protein [Vibrio sagamiensis]PNQ71228.1 MSHA biogenesis protein MshP [Vibrio agarivorans]GEM75950.1 MSHA biogenesis protein MshP [Vibrio sagamiensis NBRC 104589]